jgi:hypothetical protein
VVHDQGWHCLRDVSNVAARRRRGVLQPQQPVTSPTTQIELLGFGQVTSWASLGAMAAHQRAVSDAASNSTVDPAGQAHRLDPGPVQRELNVIMRPFAVRVIMCVHMCAVGSSSLAAVFHTQI